VVAGALFAASLDPPDFRAPVRAHDASCAAVRRGHRIGGSFSRDAIIRLDSIAIRGW
jgi:hypothetical protein